MDRVSFEGPFMKNTDHPYDTDNPYKTDNTYNTDHP